MTAPLKIFYCLKNFLPEQVAGTEVYVAALCQALLAQGHDVRVVKPNYKATVHTEYTYNNIRVMEYPEDPGVNKELITGRIFVKGLPGFKLILEQEKPDIIHFHEISGSNGITIQHMRIARSLGIDVYTTLHLVRYVCKTSTLRYKNSEPCDGVIHTRKCAACLLTERGVNSSVADIIAMAGDIIPKKFTGAGTGKRGKLSSLLSYPSYIESHKAELENLFTLSKKVFILNEWFRDILLDNKMPGDKMIVLPRARSQENSPADHGLKMQVLKGDTVRLVYVGRISRIKGLLLLLRSLAELQTSNWILDIYGKISEEDYYQECLELSRNNKAISWKGLLEPQDVVSVISQYDLLIFPTLVQEMSPLITLESFAAGTPVLASDLHANTHEITAGQNGWLFKTGDHHSLRTQLENILKAPGLLNAAKQQLPLPNSFTDVANIHAEVYRINRKQMRPQDKTLSLHCLNHFLPAQTAGTEVYTWALCKGLHEAGIGAEVAIPNYGETEYSSYDYDGIKVHRFAEPSIVDRDLQMGFRVPDGLVHFIHLLEKIQPDIVHFHELAGSNGFTVAHVEAASNLGIKTVMTFHLASYTCKANSLMYKDKIHCDGKIIESRCSECMIKTSTAPVLGEAINGMSQLFHQSGINVSRYESKLATALGYPFIIRNLKRDFDRLTAASSKLVVLTKWYENILILNRVSPAKIFYNPQGLIRNDFIFNKTNVAGKTLKLVFVGRISHFKGIHIILDALEKLEDIDLQMDFYGSEPEDDYARKAIGRMSKMRAVSWKGKLDPAQVVRTMAGYDALLLASTFSEMSPLVIREAFAAGIPVIASDVYGNAEQVEEHRNGWLFEFKNATDLARKIRHIALDRSALDSAHDFPEPRSFDAVVDGYCSLYSELVPSVKETFNLHQGV